MQQAGTTHGIKTRRGLRVQGLGFRVDDYLLGGSCDVVRYGYMYLKWGYQEV